MENQEIVNLMLRSCKDHPYRGTLSKEDNVIAAIDLAKLCKTFAEGGQSDEAMNISPDQWSSVISDLESMLNNHE